MNTIGLRVSRTHRPGYPAMFLLMAFIVAANREAVLSSPAGQADAQRQDGFDKDAYIAGVLAQRKARDEDFRSRKWSPLAVIAIAPLDRPRTTIGSDPAADLRLPAGDAAAIHAEVLREKDSSGRRRFRLRPVEGRVWSVSKPPTEIRDMPFEASTRVRVGRFILYRDELGTFGTVIRALDYTTPAFARFRGLSYFPPDPAYRVQATVTRYPKVERTMVRDTRGWQRPAWRFGEASFMLDGRQLLLVLLLFNPNPGPNETFFIAFTDETRGKETYPAARYMQPRFMPSGPIILDFNLATNPSCAYNRGFACPLPPRENRLPLPIRAGEKIYPRAAGH